METNFQLIESFQNYKSVITTKQSPRFGDSSDETPVREQIIDQVQQCLYCEIEFSERVPHYCYAFC